MPKNAIPFAVLALLTLVAGYVWWPGGGEVDAGTGAGGAPVAQATEAQVQPDAPATAASDEVDDSASRQKAGEELVQIEVREADGSASVRRRLELQLEYEGRFGSVLDGNSGDDGIWAFEVATLQENLDELRLAAGSFACRVAVIDPSARTVVTAEPFDPATTRHLILELPARAGALVRVEGYPGVYPQLTSGREERFAPGVRRLQGVQLADGWWRFEPLALNEEWTVTLWHGDVDEQSGVVHGGLNTTLPRHYFTGPTQVGEFVRTTVRPGAGPGFTGRFVDEQGEPFRFLTRQRDSMVMAVGSRARPRRAHFHWLTLFPDGRFVSRPQDGQWHDDQSLADFDSLQVVWDDRGGRFQRGTDGEPGDPRLEVERAATVPLDLPPDANFMDLGDLVLAADGSLLEVLVRGPDGEPWQGASVRVELVYDTDRGERTSVVPVRRSHQTDAMGLARVFAPSWDWVAEFGASERLRSIFGKPSHGRVTVSAAGSSEVVRDFELQDERVEVQLARAGQLAGSIVVPSGVTFSQVSVCVVPPGVAVEDGDPLAIARLRGGLEPGQFQLNGIPPGRVDVVVTLNGANWELVRIPNVLIEPGSENRPPELADFDLQQHLRLVDLRLGFGEAAPSGPSFTILVCQREHGDALRAAVQIDPTEVNLIPLPAGVSTWSGTLRISGYRTVPLQRIEAGPWEIEMSPLHDVRFTVSALEGVDREQWSVYIRPLEESDQGYLREEIRMKPGQDAFMIPGAGQFELHWQKTVGPDRQDVGTTVLLLSEAQLAAGVVDLTPPAELLPR